MGLFVSSSISTIYYSPADHSTDTLNQFSGYSALPWAGITYLAIVTGYKNVSAKHVTRCSRYMVCALSCMATWLMYGVVWCISEGANILSPNVEGVLYGIADLMGLAYFGLVLWAAQV